MMKDRFFVLRRDEHTGSVKAVAVNGYTDGGFGYYKLGSWWHAIERSYGLSVATAHTRKEACIIAYAHLDKLREYEQINGESMRQLFLEKAREAATIE